MSKKPTLASLDKRQTALECKVDEVLDILKNLNAKPVISTGVAIINIKTRKNAGEVLDVKTQTVTDKFGNVYTKLPVIFIKVDETNIQVSLKDIDGFTKIEPQLVSTYKNSIGSDGLIHSIKGVAPDFNQISFNKSIKFFAGVGAEHLSWLTLFAYQLLVLSSSIADEVLSITEAEKYDSNSDRGTGFKDTHDNGYLGISQLFDAGYTFFSCDKKHPLFKVFASLNGQIVPIADKFFGLVGSWGKYSNLLFVFGWDDTFDGDWSDRTSARLCKPFLKWLLRKENTIDGRR